MKLLDDGLEAEKNRLTKEKYFDKENIGHFMEYLKQNHILEDWLLKRLRNILGYHTMPKVMSIIKF